MSKVTPIKPPMTDVTTEAGAKLVTLRAWKALGMIGTAESLVKCASYAMIANVEPEQRLGTAELRDTLQVALELMGKTAGILDSMNITKPATPEEWAEYERAP